MRRYRLGILIITLLILSGCGALIPQEIKDASEQNNVTGQQVDEEEQNSLDEAERLAILEEESLENVISLQLQIVHSGWGADMNWEEA